MPEKSTAVCRSNYRFCKRCCSIAVACAICWTFSAFLQLATQHRQKGSFDPSKLLEMKTDFVSTLDLNRPTKLIEEALTSSIPHRFWPSLENWKNKSDPCAGKYVYIQKIPSVYNAELIPDCRDQNLSTAMRKHVLNGGLGPELDDQEGVLSGSSWYDTDQFSLDLIFHTRMRQYKCLTSDSGAAALIYVPFYASLDISRHLWDKNLSARDYLATAFVRWLESQPEWSVMGGRDHFLVGGRLTWDFRRYTDAASGWGNKLLLLPAVQNMSVLLIEKSPLYQNDFAVPYPTYFHPSMDSEVLEWQNQMRTRVRTVLFSFAGAPRPELQHSIRDQLISQCKESKFCNLFMCSRRRLSECNAPIRIMNWFQESVFCLQPAGDSYTRRSLFDCMVAGCIPVLFYPQSAYTQYAWHLPSNHSTYSVFVPVDDVRRKNASIEQILRKIPTKEVEMMREQVINLIPSLIYAHPRHRLKLVRDAFDVSIEALIHKVAGLRTKNIN